MRLMLAMIGGVLVTLLATAACLQPSPNGMGTHRQLGLPPCSFIVMAGVRCPSCGMTTSWANLMRGRLVASLQANCGGTLLGLTSLLVGPWAIVSGVRGRWIGGTPDERVVAAVAVAIISVTLVDWAIRLSR
jgi:hypothetical protein